MEKNWKLLLEAIVKGMDYDPGHSDLDDEQPVHVCIPLGEYRRARRMLLWLDRPSIGDKWSKEK